MDVNEILNGLGTRTGELPRDALDAAAERQEEITPHLIRIIEDAARDLERLAKDEHDRAPAAQPCAATAGCGPAATGGAAGREAEEDRAQRALPLRQRQEVQALLRRLSVRAWHSV